MPHHLLWITDATDKHLSAYDTLSTMGTLPKRVAVVGTNNSIKFEELSIKRLFEFFDTNVLAFLITAEVAPSSWF